MNIPQSDDSDWCDGQVVKYPAVYKEIWKIGNLGNLESGKSGIPGNPAPKTGGILYVKHTSKITSD